MLRLARARLLLMHGRARVGHVGGNLSALDATMLVHHELMGREDRFVLSKGHSAGALYVALWSLGRISDAELDTFHGEGTRLAGHPPPRGLPGVPFATGSLGHGLSIASGLALAARFRGVDRRVFCLTSDGEWQEGSTWEALIFAAHHRLCRLTILVDHNRLQGFGTTAEVASMEPLADRIRGFGAELRSCDGHDLDAMRRTLAAPGDGRPVVALLETRKGHGVPSLADRLDSHYLPLTDAQLEAALAGIGAETDTATLAGKAPDPRHRHAEEGRIAARLEARTPSCGLRDAPLRGAPRHDEGGGSGRSRTGSRKSRP